MAATREEIVAQLADLRAARASGMKMVRRGEREIQYRSDKELLSAIKDLENDLAVADTGRKRRRFFTTSTGKGL